MALDNNKELEEVDSWQIPIRSGAIWALLAIVVQLAFYLIYGMQTSALSMSSILSVLITFLLSVVMLYLAMKNYRDENQNGYITFGQGLKVGMKATLVFTLLMIIYNYVFLTFIEPDFASNIFEAEIEKMEDAEMPIEQIEMTEKMFKIFSNPLVTALTTVIYSFVVGLFLSLIAAAIAKKEQAGIA